MVDILFLALLIAFFALAAVFVRACERIIGPEALRDALGETSESARELAA